MHHLKSIHLIVGLLGLIVFVLTGQYMGIFLNGMQGMPDGPRMLYRSAHLYLMWASLLNLVVGFRFAVARPNMRIVQTIASVALLVTPALLLSSFLIESRAPDLNRSLASWANYLALGGTLLHVMAGIAPVARQADQAGS